MTDSAGGQRTTSRRAFLQSVAAVGAGTAVWNDPGEAVGGLRPNILIVLTDQEREDIPRRLMSLPHRAELEQRGIRLTHNFVTAPQCSASRATLMTGLYPHQAGVVTNVDRTSLGRAISSSLPTLGKVFRASGYKAAYLGKWHLTDGLGGRTNSKDDSNALRAFGFDHYHFVSGARLADSAADWIAGQNSRPWLLVVSFPYLPHNMYAVVRRMQEIKVRPGVELPPNFDDNLEGKPVAQRQFLTRDQGKPARGWGKEEWLRYRSYYLDLIEKVDGYLGTILKALRHGPDADDTVVVYSSDHGDMGGAHRLPFKGPFMYDELLRVPLVISWPRRFRSAVVSDSMVSSIDLAPTLAAVAGVEWPQPLPGKDFTLLFDRPKETVRAEVFAEYYGKQHWVNPIRTIRTTDWKYNLYVAPGREVAEELYDLRIDPGELRNLAGQAAFIGPRADLRARLLNWRRQTRDPLL
jgi:arylsulfatase A-like enzyme